MGSVDSNEWYVLAQILAALAGMMMVASGIFLSGTFNLRTQGDSYYQSSLDSAKVFLSTNDSTLRGLFYQ